MRLRFNLIPMRGPIAGFLTQKTEVLARSLTQITPQNIFFLSLVILGIFARFHDLAWHFTHYDDFEVIAAILRHKHPEDFQIFAIPRTFTFAPFQFIFTHFLMNPSMDYRELLFWGRFPSFVSGSLGLVAMGILYRNYGKVWPLFSALALLAFSWEDVIVAKQAHNYALGVTAAVCLIAGYLYNLKNPDFSPRRAVSNALFLGLLASMHYQILFFIPPFWAALFFYALKHKKTVAEAAAFIFTGSFVCLVVLAPLYHFFLYKLGGAGVNWNAGPHGQYLLTLSAVSWAGQAGQAALFYGRNFLIVFQSMLTCVPYGSPWIHPLSVFLLLLYGLGWFSYARSRETRTQFLALFFMGVIFVWMGLIAVHRFALSPTRHSLMLLPVFCIVISDGLGYAVKKIKGWGVPRVRAKFVHAAFAVLLAGLFFSTLLAVSKERRDLFCDDEIVGTMKRYDVDIVFSSLQGLLMKKVNAYIKTSEVKGGPVGKKKNIVFAYLSRMDDLSPGRVDELSRGLGMAPENSEREMLYRRALKTTTEVEIYNGIETFPNTIYFYIYKISSKQ